MKGLMIDFFVKSLINLYGGVTGKKLLKKVRVAASRAPVSKGAKRRRSLGSEPNSGLDRQDEPGVIR